MKALLPFSDLSLIDAASNSALHVAVRLGRLSFIELLLPYSDLQLTDFRGRTPLQLAQHTNVPECTECIAAFLVSQSEQLALTQAVPPSPNRRSTRKL